MFIFSNKHTCQKKWFCWFISIRTLMRCVRLSHQYTHIVLIDILAGTYSLTSCFFLCRLSYDGDDGHWTKKTQWMALMTDTHTHKCRQESIEWSMSHPKRSLTWVAFACWLAIVIIRQKKLLRCWLTFKITHAYQGHKGKDKDNWTLELLTKRCIIRLIRRLALAWRFLTTYKWKKKESPCSRKRNYEW